MRPGVGERITVYYWTESIYTKVAGIADKKIL